MRTGRIHCADANGGRHIAYTEWGAADNPRVVVCVHGLTRNRRDFDFLGQALADEYRVICPDIAGRGDSDRLTDSSRYTIPTYVTDMIALIDELGGGPVDWLGTSMGGLIGMALAGQAPGLLRSLLINDIGPFIPKAALRRIHAYLSQNLEFPTVDDAENHLRAAHAPFGPLTDEQWRHLTKHSVRRHDDGLWRMHYDPRIVGPFADGIDVDMELWQLWESIDCPVTVFRGKESDLLLEETAREMKIRGPKATIVEFDGIGHAPALMSVEQISRVGDWLDANGL